MFDLSIESYLMIIAISTATTGMASIGRLMTSMLKRDTDPLSWEELLNEAQLESWSEKIPRLRPNSSPSEALLYIACLQRVLLACALNHGDAEGVEEQP